MKKLALILGSLLVVGTVTQAKEIVAVPTPIVVEEATVVEQPVVVENVAVVEKAQPALRLTSVGQSLEVDNTSGGANIGESVLFLNQVNLATDNWTYGITGGVVFSSDTDHMFEDSHARMQLDAVRNFENAYAGVRWRAEDTYNRYYLRTGYNYGMFSGWMDVQSWVYDNGSKNQDKMELEMMPANVTLGPITVGYYLDYNNYSGAGQTTDHGMLQESYNHQIRAYLPVYTGEKLGLDLEYRLGLHNSKDFNNKKVAGYTVYKDFQYNSLTLNATYAVNDALDISTYYRYDINNFEAKDGAANTNSGKYYGEFAIGWNYSF